MANDTKPESMGNMPNMTYGPMELNNEEKEEIREVSIINQAVFLYRRQDRYMDQAHNLLDIAAMQYDPSGNILVAIMHKFRNGYMPTEFAMHDKDMNKIDKKITEINKRITEEREKGKITADAYSDIHGMFYDLFKLLYQGNQRGGMGMPKEAKLTSRSKIEEAMKQ